MMNLVARGGGSHSNETLFSPTESENPMSRRVGLFSSGAEEEIKLQLTPQHEWTKWKKNYRN